MEKECMKFRALRLARLVQDAELSSDSDDWGGRGGGVDGIPVVLVYLEGLINSACLDAYCRMFLQTYCAAEMIPDGVQAFARASIDQSRPA
jgi:hypothetical protein